MERVVYLDAGTIEGGDVMLHDGLVLVGLSEETSPAGIDALRYQLGRLGIDRQVRARHRRSAWSCESGNP